MGHTISTRRVTGREIVMVVQGGVGGEKETKQSCFVGRINCQSVVGIENTKKRKVGRQILLNTLGQRPERLITERKRC